MNLYCITHKKVDYIEKLNLIPSGVGNYNYPDNYENDKEGENISEKNSSYGELTFHYWFWKNKIDNLKKNEWFGFCHYRRFFVKDNFSDLIQNSENRQGFINKKLNLGNLKEMLILEPKKDWENKDVILCEPIDLQKPKKMKIFKHGFKSLIRNPLVLFNKKKCTVKLQFEMSHGYDNLKMAIDLLPKNEKSDFLDYINTRTSLSPNCMFMTKSTKLTKDFYESVFPWLHDCEKVFGLEKTKDYGTQRMYNFLFERYMPYWFEKYSKVSFSSWLYYDFTKK